jgi:hypothetical protein
VIEEFIGIIYHTEEIYLKPAFAQTYNINCGQAKKIY